MQVNIVSCVFVLDSEKNENIRKNDVKKIKVLLNTDNELPIFSIKNTDLKKQTKDYVSNIIGTNFFHLEQVYAMDYKNAVDVIYLGITNKDSINELDSGYKLVDFNVIDNKLILLDDKEYEYKTKEIEDNNNIEYIHEINNDNTEINRYLLDLLISYKRIRSNIDNTDIVFKFMGNTFTLEDVRIVYELIKNCSVDKSNFRKKIIKYCEKTDDNTSNTKNGYRPSQKYKFKPLKGDAWV